MKLEDLSPLFFDCQTTGSVPTSAQMTQLAWADGKGLAKSEYVHISSEDRYPSRIRRLTGVEYSVYQSALPESDVMQRFLSDVQKSDLLIAHFAKFEIKFLSHASEYFPTENVICTHELSRRLLPDLPSKGLKAIAGYFGHSVHEIKDAPQHVEATIAIWEGLKSLLQNAGITDLPALQVFLHNSKAPRRGRLKYLIADKERLSLPAVPGVYRFLNKSGQILYVGKASNLKQRVNSYFKTQKNIGSRHSEFLTQAARIDFSICASPLEAALMETDDIKHFNPSYNRAAKAYDRKIELLTADFTLQAKAAKRSGVRLSFAKSQVEEFESLYRIIVGDTQEWQIGYLPVDDETLIQGLAQFKQGVCENFSCAPSDISKRQLVALGLIWLRERIKEKRREELLQESVDIESAEGQPEEIESREQKSSGFEADLTPDDVCKILRATCYQFAKSYLIAKDLLALANSEVSWQARKSIAHCRFLKTIDGQVVSRGSIYEKFSLLNSREKPSSESYERKMAPILTLDQFDRMRVLRSEIRAVRKRGLLRSISSHANVLWMAL